MKKIIITIQFIAIIFLILTCMELKTKYEKENEYEHLWASYYCLDRNATYKTDMRPHLTMDLDLDGNITRVSVVCQGEPILK